MMITKEERVRGEILRGERFFVERDSSWREILRGEKRSTERFFKERLSPWREQPRRDDLHGEDISTVKSRWRDARFNDISL
jgi:hypothetical protein